MCTAAIPGAFSEILGELDVARRRRGGSVDVARDGGESLLAIVAQAAGVGEGLGGGRGAGGRLSCRAVWIFLQQLFGRTVRVLHLAVFSEGSDSVERLLDFFFLRRFAVPLLLAGF